MTVLDGSHIAFTATNAITRSVQLLGASAIVDVADGAAINSSGTYGIFANQPGQTINSLGAISGAISGGASGMAILLTGAGYTLVLRSGSTVTGLINAGPSTGTNTVMLAGTLNGDYAGGAAADNVTLTDSTIVTGILDGAAGIDALTFDIATTSAFDMGWAINFESRVKTGAGTLNLAGNSETIGTLFGAGAITLGAGRLTVDQSANSSYAGVISGSGGLTKAGSGLLELTGVNTYTGPTLISGGNLAVNGSIASAVTTSNGGILSGMAGWAASPSAQAASLLRAIRSA